jgi:hypothetical protein
VYLCADDRWTTPFRAVSRADLIAARFCWLRWRWN